MKCDEFQTLHGPYLDSELDARTTLEIEQHLKACAECARLFAEEEKLEARIKAGLKQGPRTPALWAQIERGVVGDSTRRSKGAQRNAEEMNPLRVSASLWVSALTQLRAGWQMSRWAWAGLAAVWAVILVLNSAAREPNAPLVPGQDLPSASEMRLALKQKDLLMAELAFSSEPAAKPKPAPPSPRSDRRRATFNT
jgi:anti-sigma factor RsiW